MSHFTHGLNGEIDAFILVEELGRMGHHRAIQPPRPNVPRPPARPPGRFPFSSLSNARDRAEASRNKTDDLASVFTESGVIESKGPDTFRFRSGVAVSVGNFFRISVPGGRYYHEDRTK
jgi:hypothetical protein